MSDPVKRDMMFDDWKRKPADKKGQSIWGILRKGDNKPTAKELAVVAVVTIVLAAVLYLLRMVSVYLKFYADTKEQTIFLILVAMVGGFLLWLFGRRR